MNNQITYKPDSYYKFSKDYEIIYIDLKEYKNNELFCREEIFVEKMKFQNEIYDKDVDCKVHIKDFKNYKIEEISEKEYYAVHKLYLRLGIRMIKRMQADRELFNKTSIIINQEIANNNFEQAKKIIQEYPFDVGKLDLIQKYKLILNATATDNK
jgi:hypothetical protein